MKLFCRFMPIIVTPVPYVCQVCLKRAKWVRDSVYTGREYFCHEHYVHEIQNEYEHMPRHKNHADYYDHKWVEVIE